MDHAHARALVALGYVERAADPADARRKIVARTAAGHEVLRLSAEIVERLRAERAARVGAEAMAGFEAALRAFTAGSAPPVDAVSWFDG